MQDATVDLAKAQIAAVEAQKISFGYQQKLGEITKYLFELGISNIAMNRSVVRELELKLKGASEKELDELARKEIISVVKQLKAQEDIMNKQSELSKKVGQHESELIQQQKVSKELQKQSRKNTKQDKKLDATVKRIREQDTTITEQAKTDKEHDRRVAELAKKDKEQDKLLAAGVAKDKEHDELLLKLQKENEQLLQRIEENSKAILELDYIKTNKKVTYISYAIAAAAFLAAIVQFFI